MGDKDTKDPAYETGTIVADNYIGTNPYGGRYARNQPGSQYYHPSGSGAYYGMGQKAMTDKQIALAGGVGLLGLGIERYLKAQEANTAGVRYAEQELAQAKADLKAPTPKLSGDEKDAIRTSYLAPARTEIEEIKSDVGDYLASTGRTANVEDIIAAREVGLQTIADKGLESEAVIADTDLKKMQADEVRKAAAQARADNMVQVLEGVELGQMKADQALVGDIFKVGLEAAAYKVAQDDRPAMERLRSKGVPMGDIEILHRKAIAAKYIPGTRAYDVYMMSHYEGRGGDTKKLNRKQRRASSAKVTAEPLPQPEEGPPPKEGGLTQQAAINALTQAGLGDDFPSQSPGTGIGNLLRNVTTGNTIPAAEPPAPPAPHEVLKMQEMNLLPDPVGATNALQQFLALPKAKQDEIMAIVRDK